MSKGVRMRSGSFILLFLAGVLLVLLPAGTALAASSYDQAIVDLFQSGKPQAWEAELVSHGTNPDWGFAWAGTSAELETDAYIMGLLKGFGLKHVHAEAVPLDVFTFKHAQVTVAGHEVMPASTFGGIVGTPPRGITAEVVYAGNGTKQDYERLAAAGVSVVDKLVLVDSALDDWWMNMPGSEATYRRAAGVIYTFGPRSGTWYAAEPDCLGSNDGEYDTSFVPTVYVSKQDGDWLKAQLVGGPVEATMTLDVDYQLAAEPDYDPATGTFSWVDPAAGGHAYNVFAEIPGIDPSAGIILLASHKDHHFRDAFDDTGANVNELAIAKAMMESGYRPKHTIVFLFTTAEEYGLTNSYFDWCTGAWYAINHAHPEWAGKVVGFLNLESMAGEKSALGMTTVPELTGFFEAQAKSAGGMLVNGYSVSAPQGTWQDGWTFTAAGVPSVVFGAGSGIYGGYHTQYVTQDHMGWDNMEGIARFIGGRLVPGFDSGLLPYSLKARADDLAASVTPGKLEQAGADVAVVDRLAAAVAAFRNAANRYEARKASIAPVRIAEVNAGLVQIEKAINRSLTAMSSWEDTVYPQEQVWYDTWQLRTALDNLRKPTPNAGKALAALIEVGETWNGLFFSEDVYLHDLSRWEVTPTNWRITWGGQGKLAPIFNLMPEIRQIKAGDYLTPQANLQKYWEADVKELNARLLDMAKLLEDLVPRIDALK
jgi:hypothetical protein